MRNIEMFDFLPQGFHLPLNSFRRRGSASATERTAPSRGHALFRGSRGSLGRHCEDISAFTLSGDTEGGMLCGRLGTRWTGQNLIRHANIIHSPTFAGGMEAEEGGTRRVRAVGVPASRGSQIADVVKQREDGYVCDQIVSREPHGVVAWKAVLLAEYGLGQKRS
jgi:hypothetical protein